MTFIDQKISSSSSSIYKEFSMTAADINQMGSSPFELAPVSGPGKYYLIEFILIEFTRGTIDYNAAAVDYIAVLNNSASRRTLIDKNLFINGFGVAGDKAIVPVNAFGMVATIPNVIFFSP